MLYPVMAVRNRRRRGLAGPFVGLFLLGMSLLFSAIFVYPALHARLSGVETVGTVVSISDCPESDSGGDMVFHPGQALKPLDDNVEPTIRFTDLSGHTDETQYDVCGTYDIGETFSIWYLPSDPGSIFVPQDMILIIILAIIFSVMGLIGLGLLLWFGIRVLFSLAVGGRVALQGASAASYAPPMGGNQFAAGYPASPMGINQVPGGGNHRVGEAVTVEDGWSITPTGTYPSQGDLRASPAPGSYFLMLSLTLRNVSREPLYPDQIMFKLYDGRGIEHSRVQALESPLQGAIPPGASTTLMLAFDVPGTQRQFRLSSTSSLSLLTQASWDIAS